MEPKKWNTRDKKECLKGDERTSLNGTSVPGGDRVWYESDR